MTGMRRYPSEFRESAVNMVLVEGLSVARAAADLGVPVNTLHGWITKSKRKTGPFTPQPERDMAAHVRQLEAENRTLRIERDILKKATALFAKEQQ
jgi:transposase